jgi:hypothetical protein
LATAVQAAGSGISVVGGSESYTGQSTQGGTYTGFSLSNSSTSISNTDGVVLTSGLATGIVVPVNNDPSFDGNLGTPGNAALTTLSGKPTFDANVLSFNFTVAAGNNAVTADFVFGTDEFPDQSVPDIFGFIVDGVNYAKFSDGSLINFTLGSISSNFFNNNNVGIADPLNDGSGNGFQYDGVTSKLTVTGLLDTALSTHSIVIAIADTDDRIYDSGVFISGLKAAFTQGGGGIEVIPLPASALLLMTGLVGIGALGRKRKAS